MIKYKKKKKLKFKKEENNTISSKYITFKNNIKNICYDETILHSLNDICYRTNTIVRNTYYFIRFYYSYLFENQIDFPIIDHKMIRDIFTLISSKSRKQKDMKVHSIMETFNETVFSKMNLKLVSRDNLTQNLTYETERIMGNAKMQSNS